MLWVKIAVENREVYIVALYHPPKPINRTEIILARLEATVEILSQRSGADISLVGDFNGFGESEIVQRTELSPPIHTQTMEDNTLDRLFVSQNCYRIVRLIARVTVAGSSFVFAVVYSPMPDRLSAFMPVTTDVVCTMVRVATDKHSMKDPMPTWLLKTCIDLLAPYI